jgi:enoyl-[acyl-carrier protein] reductase I
MLDGKRILVTGVITRKSIAYTVAEQAQKSGAQVLLTGFGRGKRMTERAAAKLPDPPDVLELDVNSPEDLEALTKELDSRWGGVDGALHAIAFAPEDALGGNFLAAPASSASSAFETSAFSFKSLAAALHPLMENDGGGLVGLDFDATLAWPAYDWMGVSKAALEAVGRYLARDLGPSNIRVNLVSAGPLDTPAAGGIPGFDQLAAAWGTQAPLGWDVKDPGPVADAVCFLMSDYARGITGEIIHVDGGFHAIGAAVDPDATSEGADSESENADSESSAQNGSAEEQPAAAEQQS